MAANSLKEQLTKLELKKLKMSNGKALEETMAKEAQRLYECIQYHIDKYYQSYEPRVYERTGGYQRALYAEDIADIRIVGNTLQIGVGFDYEKSMHPNFTGISWDDNWFPIEDRHETFVPMLMEMGWVSDGLASMIGRHIHRLTYFEGIGAVEEGIRDFNKTNKLGIKIDADAFYDIFKNKKAY